MVDESQSPTSADPYHAGLLPRKTIRLAACGPVLITETELNIIDTPEFQRLRYIRQLGLAYLVYPTAMHSRFEHSLGTLQMVTAMMDAICGNEHNTLEERRIDDRDRTSRDFMPLVHNITHVPFGHSVEDSLAYCVRHDENDERIDHFLGRGSTIGQIILTRYGSEFLDDLLALFTSGMRRACSAFPLAVAWSSNETDDVRRKPRKTLDPKLLYVHDLVSNTLCADLLDYLRRDRAG